MDTNYGLDPECAAFDAWLAANERRLHCGHMDDEECMRAAYYAGRAAERERIARLAWKRHAKRANDKQSAARV